MASINTGMSHWRVRAASVSLLLLFTMLAVACGTDSGDAPGAGGSDSTSDTNEFGFETSVIAKESSIYDVDDVEAAGWKRSRELPSDELDGVSEVWFGFYQQKNLEVWTYESHAAAREKGSPLASQIVARTRGVSGGGAQGAAGGDPARRSAGAQREGPRGGAGARHGGPGVRLRQRDRRGPRRRPAGR